MLFFQENPSKYGKFFYWAEGHYNTSTHSTMGYSPFQVYGRPLLSKPQYISSLTTIEAVDSTLISSDELLDSLRNNLLKKTKENEGTSKQTLNRFGVSSWRLGSS